MPDCQVRAQTEGFGQGKQTNQSNWVWHQTYAQFLAKIIPLRLAIDVEIQIGRFIRVSTKLPPDEKYPIFVRFLATAFIIGREARTLWKKREP